VLLLYAILLLQVSVVFPDRIILNMNASRYTTIINAACMCIWCKPLHYCAVEHTAYVLLPISVSMCCIHHISVAAHTHAFSTVDTSTLYCSCSATLQLSQQRHVQLHLAGRQHSSVQLQQQRHHYCWRVITRTEPAHCSSAALCCLGFCQQY
jgi:hypothetical protein